MNYCILKDATPGSELNALGLYLLVSLVFVILALVEFACVALLSRRDSPGEANLEIGTVQKLDKETNTMDKTSQTLQKRETPNEQTFTVNGWLEGLGNLQNQKKIKLFSNLPSIHIVDAISFLLFCFLFALFNVIYWIHYQM